MINWEDIIKAEEPDELQAAKLWLFQENIRLETEKNDFVAARDKFLKERVKLRDELDALNRRTVQERKRLKEDNLFFEKKMAILQAGFRQLEDDRKKFEQEKRSALEEMAARQEHGNDIIRGNVAEILFRSATNSLALRKRYRDLVKIFHPDNLFGDEELVQQINHEFVRRKREDDNRFF